MNLLQQRLKTVRLLQPLMQEAPLMQELKRSTSRLADIHRVLTRLRTGATSVNDWALVNRTVGNLIESIYTLRKTFARSDVDVPQFIQLKDLLPELVQVQQALQLVDLKESARTGRIVVQPAEFPDLHQLHHRLAKQDQRLQDLVTAIWRAIRASSTFNPSFAGLSPKSILLPNLGSFIILDRNNSLTDVELPVPTWTFQFEQEGLLLFKSPETKEFDVEVDGLCQEYFELESKYRLEISLEILEHERALQRAVNLAAELDCLFGFAIASIEYRWVEPHLTENSNVLLIEEGFHPLLAYSYEKLLIKKGQGVAIGNDTRLDNSSLLVITGPNGSGKSVYLKQVGLIVFLAHIGCFVPAKSATIGLCDRIFSSLQSNFKQSILEVTKMIETSTARSLVLLDEFGKDTNVSCGMALFASILRHWGSEQRACPKAIFSTHFHELFQQSIVTSRPSSPLLHVQHFAPSSSADSCGFTYRLADGHYGSSQGIACARRSGVLSSLTDRAEAISNILMNGRPFQKVEALNSSIGSLPSSLNSNNVTEDARDKELLSLFRNYDFSLPESVKQFISMSSKNN